MSEKISEHFYESEVRCSCGCGKVIINYKLLYMLEIARIESDTPFKITSWVRCKDYNKKIGGVTGSAHVSGKAVDIGFENEYQKYLILATLQWAGFRRVGISDKDNFIHVDVDDSKPYPAIWTY